MTAQCPAGDADPEDSKTVNHPFPHPSAHALDVRAIHFLAHYCCNSLDKNISFFMNYFKEHLELFLKNS